MVQSMFRNRVFALSITLLCAQMATQASGATVLQGAPPIVIPSAPVLTDALFEIPRWPADFAPSDAVSPVVLIAHTCALVLYALFIAWALPRRRSSSKRFERYLPRTASAILRMRSTIARTPLDR